MAREVEISLENDANSRFFVRDLNVDRFGAIFSAFYCWPEECKHSDPKCWSRVMTESPDWFSKEMWPQVVDNMPIITGDPNKVKQINQLMFALVLKELDLLTISETLYYESVLDLFNDSVTFGLMFWLKICHQFNWRQTYAKMISQHKRRKEIVVTLLKEIEKSSEDCSYTTEAICYFYSVVDAICVYALSEMAVEVSAQEDQSESFFHQTRAKCWEKQKQLEFNPFVRNIYEFNIVVEQTIYLALRLANEECIWDEDIFEQVKMLEQIFTAEENSYYVGNSLNDREMSIARDNYISLQLINKFLDSNNGLKLVLGSLEKFFKSLSKHFDDSSEPEFDLLKDILEEKENLVRTKLVEALILFADYETFSQTLSKISPKDISRELTFKLAERLCKTKKGSQTFDFFSNLLISSLKLSANIDLERRVKHFRTKKIMEADIDVIKTLFNQIIKEDKSQTDLKHLVIEVKIGAFLDPIPIYNLLLDLAIHHNKAQIGLVAKLLAQEFNSLSRFRMSDSKCDTFLVRCIDNVLINDPSLQTVEDMTKFVEQIIRCQSLSEDVKDILPLEDLFFYMIRAQSKSFQKVELTWIKLNFIKSVVELSDQKSWRSLNNDPVPTLVFVLQFLDYFWQNPIRKEIAVDLLNLVLDKKLTRNLTEDEFTLLTLLLRDSLKSSRVGKASTTQIYVAYCERRLPKPLREVIDLTQNIYHDQILHYATITTDFIWICDVYSEYNLFLEDIKTALPYILPSLTVHEFNRLFQFLQMYFYKNSVVSLLRRAIFDVDKSVDKTLLFKCLCDIVTEQILIPLRETGGDVPLSQEDFDYVKADCVIVFKAMALLEFHLLSNDMSLRLKRILTELAQRMKKENISFQALYRNQTTIPRIARSVLQEVMDANYFKSDDDQPMQTEHIPAGLVASASSHSAVQTVYQ